MVGSVDVQHEVEKFGGVEVMGMASMVRDASGGLMSQIRLIRTAALLSLAACVAACSSDAATRPAVTAVDSTASPSTSTTTVAQTSSTAAPTSVVTSTVAPSTSTLPSDADVKAGYEAYYSAYWACLRAPKSCQAGAFTASTGPARAALTKTVSDLVAGDLLVGADDVGYMVVEKVTVTSPASAVVSSCWWDTGVVYGPSATAGGDPVVVNDKRVTSRFDTTMTFEQGKWLTAEEVRTARVEGKNACPPQG